MVRIERLDTGLAQLVKSGVIITNVVDGIREVVQNSVDAQAKNIDVQIAVDYNKIDFKVTDDGVGISPDNLELVGERYYTSKIQNFGQLKRLRTFGFRGEALSSLKAIANVMIVSKTENYNGTFRVLFSNSKRYEVMMLDDQSQHYGSIKPKSGTIVHVTQMFENMPVRRDFIKSIPESKFLNSVRNVVLQCCITNPTVSITVHLGEGHLSKLVCKVNAPKEHHHFQQHASLCINSIFGINLGGKSNLLQISYKKINIECIVGLFPVQTKSHQYIYFNQRSVKDEKLFWNINKIFNSSGFGELEDEVFVSSISRNGTSPKKGRSPTKSATSVGNPYKLYPIFVIRIAGPSSQSDLLQDPSKEIADLKHHDIINPLISKLLTKFLKSHHYNPIKPLQTLSKDAQFANKENSIMINEKSKLVVLSSSRLRFGKTSDKELSGMVNVKIEPYESIGHKRTASIDSRILKRKTFSKIEVNELDCSGHGHGCDEKEVLLLEKSITREILTNCKVISQVDKKFILIKHQTSLYVIDQHACDERIKLEKNIYSLINQVNDPFCDLGLTLDTQKLLFTITNSELELFINYKDNCGKWGLVYEINDNNTIEITHLPSLMMKKLDDRGLFLKRCILQYLYDLNNKEKLKEIPKYWWLAVQSIPTILIELMNSNACRDAVMFGDELTKQECEILIKELSNCKNPFYCAHGRPSIVPIYNFNDITKD